MKRALVIAASVPPALVALLFVEQVAELVWHYHSSCRERGECPQFFDFIWNGCIRGVPKRF